VLEVEREPSPLDNLTCVLQLGTAAEPANCNSPSATYRPRTFTYNSLAQLLTAVNPESGTVSYTYDADGNVLTKVAPQPNQTGGLTVTTTYTYDALHRLLQKSYSDGATATVQYGYDAVALTGCATAPPALSPMLNPIGRRTAMCDAAGAAAWSYDALGRTLAEKRTLEGASAITKTISYTYNLDGSLATLTYPTGRVVTYAYNGAGRALSTVDAANNVNYATEALYAPHGALSSLKQGASASFAGITSTSSYNNRLQPVLLQASAPSQTVLSLSYVFDQEPGAGVINNGNVVQVVNNINNDRTQSYTYDELNRIATAQSQATAGEHCWGNSFAYDIWANLLSKTVTKCAAESLSVTVNTKNQITNTGFTYDAAGNLTNAGSGVYTYDAENRLTNAAGVTYSYDGDGKRVKKSSNMLYWTGVGSDALAEGDLAGAITAEFMFFNGRRVSMHGDSGVVYHYTADHLGSTRVLSTATTPILQDYDYYPFGGARVLVDLLGGQHYKFTGKERDGESGLDYFGARYYGSNIARFTSPDPIAIKVNRLLDPQRLNLYTYVRNNPLQYVDPDGRDIQMGPGTPKQQDQIRSALVELARTPKGRAMIERLDRLSVVIPVGHVKKKGDIKQPDGTSSPGNFDPTGARRTVDKKDVTGTAPVTVDLGLARDMRKNGEPDAPKSDAELVGHELVHADRQLNKTQPTDPSVVPNSEEDATGTAREMLDGKKSDKAEAEQFVDEKLKPRED